MISTYEQNPYLLTTNLPHAYRLPAYRLPAYRLPPPPPTRGGGVVFRMETLLYSTLTGGFRPFDFQDALFGPRVLQQVPCQSAFFDLPRPTTSTPGIAPVWAFPSCFIVVYSSFTVLYMCYSVLRLFYSQLTVLFQFFCSLTGLVDIFLALTS